jgi:hypothetical protein
MEVVGSEARDLEHRRRHDVERVHIENELHTARRSLGAERFLTHPTRGLGNEAEPRGHRPGRRALGGQNARELVAATCQRFEDPGAGSLPTEKGDAFRGIIRAEIV